MINTLSQSMGKTDSVPLEATSSDSSQTSADPVVMSKCLMDSMRTHSMDRLALALTSRSLRQHYMANFSRVKKKQDSENPSDSKVFDNIKQSFDQLLPLLEEQGLSLEFSSRSNPTISDYFNLYQSVKEGLIDEVTTIARLIENSDVAPMLYPIAYPAYKSILPQLQWLIQNNAPEPSVQQLIDIDCAINKANLHIGQCIINTNKRLRRDYPTLYRADLSVEFSFQGLTRFSGALVSDNPGYFASPNLQIRLNNNFIRKIPLELVQLEGLTTLNCSRNEIRSLPWDELKKKGMTVKRHLEFKANHISYLPVGFESIAAYLFVQKQVVKRVGGMFEAECVLADASARYGEGTPAFVRLARELASPIATERKVQQVYSNTKLLAGYERSKAAPLKPFNLDAGAGAGAGADVQQNDLNRSKTKPS